MRTTWLRDDGSVTERPSTTTMTGLAPPGPATAVEIVVPVHDEERSLEVSIRTLHEYLTERFAATWAITIVDNASTDGTLTIARRLAATLAGVRCLHVDEKGRGRALHTAWGASTAEVVAYMDVDLSTDLDALLPLVAPLLSGHSDVAIGTRLASNARVVRGPKRELISRGYNFVLRTTLRAGFSDAQCGFKAVRTDVAHCLLPLVEDQEWFFDTELLVLAEHNGLRIHEVPVDWVDDPVSRVDIVRTARRPARSLAHAPPLRGGDGDLTTSRRNAHTSDDDRLGPQLVRFASIGVVSTVVFAALFALLDGPLGPVGADVVALLMCAFANTAANRRLTFALRGRAGRVRHYVAGTALGAAPAGPDARGTGTARPRRRASSRGGAGRAHRHEHARHDCPLPAAAQLGVRTREPLPRQGHPMTDAVLDRAPERVVDPATSANGVHLSPPPRSQLARLWRGRDDDPAWVRPCLLALLAGTAVLYLWGLGASGWANTYYSAAVQAATRSWKAFFFGSFDSSNAVTVDKAPASLWVMAISTRSSA